MDEGLRIPGYGTGIYYVYTASEAKELIENCDSLMPLLEATFRERITDEWLGRLREQGVPAAPIQRVDQVRADPQVKHREMVVGLRHPTLGTLPTLGTPIKVDGEMGLEVAPPPALGQHTDEVLSALLGYPPARIAALRAAGGIA